MKIDKFLLRYGAIAGRCNAYTRKHEPCKRWPVNGHKRCHRHGAGYTRGRVNDMSAARAKRWMPNPESSI